MVSIRKHVRANVWAYVLWLAAFMLIFGISDNYYRDILTQTFLWAGLACAWNISSGFSGQLSIGHAAFLGIGAYTTGLLFNHFGISPWLSMFVGGILAALIALVMGVTTLRLQGPFFALASLAAAEVIRILAVSLQSVTNGSAGLQVNFEPGFWNMAWESKMNYEVLMFLFALALFIITVLIKRSSFGFYLVALREDSNAAEALGVNTTRYKVVAICVSAFLTALGGALYEQYYLFVDPNVALSINTSVQIALVCIIGGMGTVGGPFLGAFILIPLSVLLQGWLTSLSGLYGVVYGVALIVIVIFMPEGIIGKLASLLQRIVHRKKPTLGDEFVEYSKID